MRSIGQQAAKDPVTLHPDSHDVFIVLCLTALGVIKQSKSGSEASSGLNLPAARWLGARSPSWSMICWLLYSFDPLLINATTNR